MLPRNRRSGGIPDIAEIVAKSELSNVSADSITCAKHAILDWMGVTYAGLSEPLSLKLRECLAHGGPSSIIGTRLSASAHDAALINGATSHALDYDDVNIIGHPTAPILPAVLAVGEARDATGEDIILAFIAGYEAAAYIAKVAMPSHYARGFHSTGTLGTFGAAAGVARLLGLNTELTAHALGLAGTQAAGLKSMFGTMAKPFHARKAASNGVLAATLAAKGYQSRHDVLESEQGFLHTQCDADTTPLQAGEFGENIRENFFKFHAACYLTHSTMEALKQILREQTVTPDIIDSVTLHVPEAHLSVCNIQEPSTGLECKFSLRQCAAFILGGYDTAAITTYSDENANRGDLVELRQKVNVIGDLKPGTQAAATISTSQGQSFDAISDVGIPSPDINDQEEALLKKFNSLTNFIVDDKGEMFAQTLLNISSASSIKRLIETLPEAHFEILPSTV